ncbi:hypothetical protein AHAS_Ahas16G0325500 [Arachis hypogaea]
MDAYDGTVRLGAINLKQHDLRAGAAGEFDSGPDVSVSSPVTRQKAAAAKQFIENHYKNYLQGLQDRKDRAMFTLQERLLFINSAILALSLFLVVVLCNKRIGHAVLVPEPVAPADPAATVPPNPSTDYCVPLYNFDYIYSDLMYLNFNFVDRFKDPGPNGNDQVDEANIVKQIREVENY